MKKYKVTVETVVYVEAKNKDEAAEKAVDSIVFGIENCDIEDYDYIIKTKEVKCKR